MAELIAPQVLKGFRDSLPAQEAPKRALMAKLEQVFISYGLVPIDTPALEYTEILLGKGSGETDKQMFRFQDNGGRDVALRFDLTVPFARFMAMNFSQVPLPFKRYHMAKVWRGEKPQKGRFREFIQCDFDIVGLDSPSADFEIMSIMASSMEALGVGEATICLNHRGVFNRFLDHEGIKDQSIEILRTVDKLGKVGEDEVKQLLGALASPEKADKILKFIGAQGSYLEVLAAMEAFAGGEAEDTRRLRALFDMMKATGLEKKFKLDPSITRGLDYYTGIVFETFLNAMPQIGSVCSGGRYNDLASLYTKEKLPGVGASVGLDRLLAALEELGQATQAAAGTQVLILQQDEKMTGTYHALAQSFRARGIAAEVFLDAKKIPAQYKYAEAKLIPFVVALAQDTTAGEKNPQFQLKDIRTGTAWQGETLDTALAKIQG